MNIVIVGGGTAGWIAAYYITMSQPNKHNITLIESSKIGIINAGEGSTGGFVSLLQGKFAKKNKVNIEDFMLKTDATKKLGIRHTNWSKNKSSYFAPGDFSVTGLKDNDYIFKYVLSKFDNKKTHLASKIGIEYENERATSFAYHFDATKVGQYFKEMCGDDVSSIDAVVSQINVNSSGMIDSVRLDNEVEIKGDFFIDCSGFSKILMNKLNVKWKSYKDYLTVNTAMPFIIKYKKDEKINPETSATALSSGWMWNIPLKTRRGCGYVFDNNFISEDEAKKEVEKELKQEIEPIKFLNFDTGCLELFWKNNVIALGLASSFVEPLEATSIHNTIVQIAIFVNQYLHDDLQSTISEHSINSYNNEIMLMMDETMDWISIHYQGGREDSEFWKNIKYNNIITDKASEILKIYQHNMPKHDSFSLTGSTFVLPLLNWNLAGINKIPKDLITKELIDTDMYNFAEKEFNKYYKSFSYKKT
jgi:flavin-dependent dehydrogenase